MSIDLVNWLEIITAVLLIVCCMFKPTAFTKLFALILFITVGVEFTSKYLHERYGINHNTNLLIAKSVMYSLFNIVKFCGFSWLIYFLLIDLASFKKYVITSFLIALFVLANLFLGQGFSSYNNYSNAFGIIFLVATALYKLIQFEHLNFSRLRRYAILLFLFVIILYYSINLPFFVFFHQMFEKDKSKSIQVYRIINDGANYIFYPCLSIIALLYTFSQLSKSKQINVKS